MIAVDSNILVYAHRSDSKWHAAAAAKVLGLAQGHQPWAIPWPCIHEFLAVVTHPRIYDPPTSIEQASDQVEAWLESPSCVVLGESVDHWIVVREALIKGKIIGPMVHDARVAAICLAHGVSELWTSDRDFSRFPKLVTRNPTLS